MSLIREQRNMWMISDEKIFMSSQTSPVKYSCVLKKGNFGGIPKVLFPTQTPVAEYWFIESLHPELYCLGFYFLIYLQLLVHWITGCPQNMLYLCKTRIHLYWCETMVYTTAKLTCNCFSTSQCISSERNQSSSAKGTFWIRKSHVSSFDMLSNLTRHIHFFLNRGILDQKAWINSENRSLRPLLTKMKFTIQYVLELKEKFWINLSIQNKVSKRIQEKMSKSAMENSPQLHTSVPCSIKDRSQKPNLFILIYNSLIETSSF